MKVKFEKRVVQNPLFLQKSKINKLFVFLRVVKMQKFLSFLKMHSFGIEVVGLWVDSRGKYLKSPTLQRASISANFLHINKFENCVL